MREMEEVKMEWTGRLPKAQGEKQNGPYEVEAYENRQTNEFEHCEEQPA